MSCEDCRGQQKVVKELHRGIIEKSENVDELLWQAVIAFQDYPFYTASGLPFSYIVKQRRDGNYSGELVVSRKEGSKTVTRSSIQLAFHRVLETMSIEQGASCALLKPAEYKGPKAMGQIFGISYIFSLFWKLGLIRVPLKIQEKWAKGV